MSFFQTKRKAKVFPAATTKCIRADMGRSIPSGFDDKFESLSKEHVRKRVRRIGGRSD